jgi:hypothetical protein
MSERILFESTAAVTAHELALCLRILLDMPQLLL